MAQEMNEQPTALMGLYDRASNIVSEIKRKLPPPYRGILVVARGSSDNAATYGQYLLTLSTGCPVTLAAPSLTTRYDWTSDLRGWLAIGVSQSGETPEVLTVLERMIRDGASALAITNDEKGQLSTMADVAINLGAGPEKAVPATKSLTATMGSFALVGQALGQPLWNHDGWLSMVSGIEEVLNDWESLDQTVMELSGASPLLTLGRGFHYATARETALKLSETTGNLTTAFSPPDLLHGPIGAASEDWRVISHVSEGPVLGDVITTVDALCARGAVVHLITDVPGLASGGKRVIPVPRTPEPLAPITHVVRGQQLALLLSRAAGIDPDYPQGLNKVTLTH